MRKLFLTCIAAGALAAMPLPALACGGGGCGMGGGMGGRGGYYGGARARASTKVLSGGPRVARSALPAGRTAVNAAKPAKALAEVNQPASTQARTVAAKTKVAAPPIYTCPMHPQVQWTKPTDCPICGMKLKLKQAKINGAPPASDGAEASTDEMGEMPGMEEAMGDMDDMMCCPGCMQGMGGMSGMSGGKKSPAASRKAGGGSTRSMPGVGCGC